MAINLKREFIPVDEKNITSSNIDDYYVMLNISGMPTYFPISKLEIETKPNVYVSFKSVKEFFAELKSAKRKIRVKDEGHEVDSSAQAVYHDTKWGKTFVSTSINGSNANGSTHAVPYGLKRVIDVNSNNYLSLSDSDYVYAGLMGSDSMQYINAGDIGYYDGMRFVSLTDIMNDSRLSAELERYNSDNARLQSDLADARSALEEAERVKREHDEEFARNEQEMRSLPSPRSESAERRYRELASRNTELANLQESENQAITDARSRLETVQNTRLDVGTLNNIIQSLLNGRDLYTRDNRYVTDLFVDYSFSMGNVSAEESIDLSTGTRSVLDESTLTTRNIEIDPSYSVQVSRTDAGQHVLDTTNYHVEPDRNVANFFKVRLQGDTVDTMVSLDQIYAVVDGRPAETPMTIEHFTNDLIGQSVYVKMTASSEPILTEPLTADQVMIGFSNKYTLQPTNDTEDILAEGTYLRLRDGRYVEERTAVRPICYDYTTKGEFDCYFVRTEPLEANKGVIVPKDTFKSRAEVKINGMTLRLSNAVRLVETTRAISQCDVIQTTTNLNGYQECEPMRMPKYKLDMTLDTTVDGVIITEDLYTDNKDEKLRQIETDFIEKYKNNQYDIEKVLDGDRFVELDPDHVRYHYTDTITREDHAHDTNDYRFLKSGTLVYNGKTKKFEGGPHYETGKHISYEVKKGLKNIAATTVGIFNAGGIFALALYPVALAVAAGAVVATPILASAAHLIIGGIKNGRKYKFKDRTTEHRKGLEKEVNSDLIDIYSNSFDMEAAFEKYIKQQVKKNNPNLSEKDLETAIETARTSDEYRADFQRKKADYYRVFLDRMRQVEGKVEDFSTTHYMAEFRMVDGKGEVNETNAPLFSIYRQEMSNLEKEIKKLQRQYRRHPSESLKITIENKQAEYDAKALNYTSSGQEVLRDESFDRVDSRVKMMKGLLSMKFFREQIDDHIVVSDTEVSEELEIGGKIWFTTAQVEMLKHLDYNPEKQKWSYKGHYFNTQIGPKTKGKHTQLDANINGIMQRLSALGEILPEYNDEENVIALGEESGVGVLREAPVAETADTATAEAAAEATAEAGVSPDVEATHTAEHEASASGDTPPSKPRRTTERKRATTLDLPKTRLSVDSLEELLSKIERLQELDNMYFSADENLPSNIDSTIRKLEKAIGRDLHLLKSAGTSKSDRYDKYKSRIINAEKILKDHQLFNDRKARINVSATI